MGKQKVYAKEFH